jgi:hypothetical protein
VSRDSDAIYEAIDRWVDAGLVDESLARTLRAEVAGEAEVGTRRLAQYVLAVTGGAVVLLAGGVFLDWAWPLLDRAARALVLAAAGIGVLVAGVRIEGTRRWLPASYLMQTSGLGLLLGAFVYSEGAWRDLSAGGLAVGVLSLAVPIVLAPRAMRTGVVMPAVHLAAGLGFLAVFLDRATPLSGDSIVWVLDAVLLVAALVLLRLLADDPEGDRHPWALNAFVMAMLAGFVLVATTALGPLDLSDDAIWALDVWLGLCVGLTLLGARRRRPGLSREWLGRLLAGLLCAWIVFGFYTALEPLDGPPELPLLLVGGAGVAAFVYAHREGFRTLMSAAALAFIAPLWYWAVERGGALGAVAALAVTAGLLFWLSGRTGPAAAARAERFDGAHEQDGRPGTHGVGDPGGPA